MSMNTPVESLLVIEEPPIPSVQYIQDANAVEKEKKKSRKPSKSTRIKRKPLTDYKLITSTGRPKSENGIYVQEEEKKMNESEKVACFIYVERECKKEKRFEKFSNRQKKRFCFQKRLIFLLNKSLMMRIFQSNNSKEAAKNKKKAVNQDYPMISGSVRKPNFDICYNENNGENDVLNLSGNHGFGENNEVPARFTSSGGYQSIADDGQDVFNPWLSAAATVPQDYISFRDSTFDISANFRQPAEYSSFDSCSLPPPISTASTNYDECLAPLLPVTNIDSFQSSYNSVHPNVISPIPTSGYVSMYRQQFPSQNLEMANNLNMIRFNSPPPLDLLFQSVDKQSKLEESEEELARAKRLIEIEKELNIINEKNLNLTMNSRLVCAVAVLVIFVSAQSDEDWDPTVRDFTEFCSSMSLYTPNGEVYCAQFKICCDRQFDPNNGDKCQLKESECSQTDDGRSGLGICKLSNCTELITTTTTTTTPAPLYESVNAAYQAVTIIAPLAAVLFCVM